jgi:hypothetical protein
MDDSRSIAGSSAEAGKVLKIERRYSFEQAAKELFPKRVGDGRYAPHGGPQRKLEGGKGGGQGSRHRGVRHRDVGEVRMPNPQKGPRLYLRRRKGREPVWAILDGKIEEGTGCRQCDRAGAEKALANISPRNTSPPVPFPRANSGLPR